MFNLRGIFPPLLIFILMFGTIAALISAAASVAAGVGAKIRQNNNQDLDSVDQQATSPFEQAANTISSLSSYASAASSFANSFGVGKSASEEFNKLLGKKL